jgi:hypothetical protein
MWVGFHWRHRDAQRVQERYKPPAREPCRFGSVRPARGFSGKWRPRQPSAAADKLRRARLRRMGAGGRLGVGAHDGEGILVSGGLAWAQGGRPLRGQRGHAAGGGPDRNLRPLPRRLRPGRTERQGRVLPRAWVQNRLRKDSLTAAIPSVVSGTDSALLLGSPMKPRARRRSIASQSKVFNERTWPWSSKAFR